MNIEFSKLAKFYAEEKNYSLASTIPAGTKISFSYLNKK